MKKLLMLVILLCLLMTLVACRHEGETMAGEEAIDFLEFSTLEDFLVAHRAVRLDEDIASLTERWGGALSASDLEDAVESTNFASLETLSLPTGIPEEFQVRKITITNYGITFWYLPEHITVSRDTFWSAISQNPSFQFSISRRQENEMELILQRDNVNREDLIDGKYLFFYPNMFVWESDGVMLLLYTPTPSHDAGDETRMVTTEIDGISLDDPYAMVRFTETATLNLQDTRAVETMIAELEATRR